MAKLATGILGKVTGKVANVVGGTWKGINYVREYLIPSNPRSTAQTAVREKFAYIAEMTRRILGDLVKPYYLPIVSGQPLSEWNKHISFNMLQSATASDPTNFGFYNNGNNWFSDFSSSSGTGGVDFTWVEESSEWNFPEFPEFYKPIILVTQADDPSKTKKITLGDELSDEASHVPDTSFPGAGTYYLALGFEYAAETDPAKRFSSFTQFTETYTVS